MVVYVIICAKIKLHFIQNRVEIAKLIQLTEILGKSWSKGRGLCLLFHKRRVEKGG